MSTVSDRADPIRPVRKCRLFECVIFTMHIYLINYYKSRNLYVILYTHPQFKRNIFIRVITFYPCCTVTKYIETLKPCSESARVQLPVPEVRTDVFVHRRDLRDFFRTGRLHVDDPRTSPVLVPPVFESERDTSQTDPNENHNEHPADILDADSVGLIFLLLALLRFRIPGPPLLFETLQLPFVQ